MKRIWKPGFGLLLLAAPVWVACDDDDDKDNGLWGDANITQAATTRYPGAQITEIERTPWVTLLPPPMFHNPTLNTTSLNQVPS